MKLKIYQVDAFADAVFSGNPAAVIPLGSWLPDEVMQNIGMENNLSETAFFIPNEKGFHIRWFTPVAEVNLCGHATLASAHVIFNHLNFKENEIIFQSQSGVLKVKKRNDFLFLDFPVSRIKEMPLPKKIENAFSIMPKKCFKGLDVADMMLVFNSEKDIENLNPNYEFIKTLDARGIIATSQSSKYDFVSRFFAHAVGINEDPVTGSAHTVLIPYWESKLEKTEMTAKQISGRGGVILCKYNGDRVETGGRAFTYLTGEIQI